MKPEFKPNNPPVTRTEREYYRFFIVVRDGAGGETETEWRGLSRTRARNMYAYTNAAQPINVVTFGWELTK